MVILGGKLSDRWPVCSVLCHPGSVSCPETCSSLHSTSPASHEQCGDCFNASIVYVFVRKCDDRLAIQWWLYYAGHWEESNCQQTMLAIVKQNCELHSASDQCWSVSSQHRHRSHFCCETNGNKDSKRGKAQSILYKLHYNHHHWQFGVFTVLLDFQLTLNYKLMSLFWFFNSLRFASWFPVGHNNFQA